MIIRFIRNFLFADSYIREAVWRKVSPAHLAVAERIEYNRYDRRIMEKHGFSGYVLMCAMNARKESKK